MPVALIGQTLNPTGFARLEAALTAQEPDFPLQLAQRQLDAGAAILDINGGGGANEARRLCWLARTVRAAFPTATLALDSGSQGALSAAARMCSGPVILNSACCREASWQTLFPLAQRIGAAVILLPLGEGRLPQTAEERVKRLSRLLDRALEAGLPRERVWADCLALPEITCPSQRDEALRAVELVRTRLGLETVLGISNISYGASDRSARNAAFLRDALQAGLTRPILDPCDPQIQAVLG